MKIFFLLFVLSLTRCYSTKQAWGQLRLLNAREPIEDVLRKTNLDPKIRARLERVGEILKFAAMEGLKTENAYKKFVSLDQNAISYTVQAAEKYELKSKNWWFPVVGSVPYLGFFKLADRDVEAKNLQAENYDIALGEVDAFSSLGWFDDPVYSPMLNRGDAELMHLFFHELTHRTLWVKGSVEFNENLAEFVGHLLTQKMLLAENKIHELKRYLGKGNDRLLFHQWIKDLKAELQILYDKKPPAMEREKTAIFERFIHQKPLFQFADYVGKKPWNNAHVLGASLYSPDEVKFQNAFACQKFSKVGDFLNLLEKKSKDAEDPLMALEQLCSVRNQ